MPRLRLPGRRRGGRSNHGRAGPGKPLYNARIVVGLGNPGGRYATHRHNAGARVVALLSERLALPLTQESKLCVSGQGATPFGPVVLAQPRVFMNESGRAVQSLLTQHRAHPRQLILIVDELDIEVGRIRVRGEGGDGGQKGMRSIRETIGALDFPRVRIGVGRPYVNDEPSHHPDVVADHLLASPIPEERAALRAAEAQAAEAVIAILRDGVEAAMNAFNGVPAPPVERRPRQR